jgi:hypothetical protein
MVIAHYHSSRECIILFTRRVWHTHTHTHTHTAHVRTRGHALYYHIIADETKPAGLLDASL